MFSMHYYPQEDSGFFVLFSLSLFCSKMVLSGVLNPKAKGEVVRVRCIKTEQSGHVFYDVR